MVAWIETAGTLRVGSMGYPVRRVRTLDGISEPATSGLPVGKTTEQIPRESWEVELELRSGAELSVLRGDVQTARGGALPLFWTDDEGQIREVYLTAPVESQIRRGRIVSRLALEEVI